MPFEAGNTYGSKSSRKGVANKSTEQIKEQIALLIEKNIPKLQQSLDGMKKVEFFNAVMQLMKYHIPTLKAIEVEANVSNENYSEEIFERLIKIDDETFKKLEDNE